MSRIGTTCAYCLMNFETSHELVNHTRMGHTRVKKPVAYTVGALNEAHSIVEDFIDFVDGFRVILLIHRSKDGAKNSTRHERMLFTRNRQEFEETLAFMLEERDKNVLNNLRVYSTVNSRNLKKSIQLFKHDLIDMENMPENVVSDFFSAIKSRFASCLMRNSNKDESYFVFDIDDPTTLDEALQIFEESGFSDEIVKQYKTKNGWHIITKPFNYTKLTKELPMNKDGLILLKY